MSTILIAIAAGAITATTILGLRTAVGRWRDPEDLKSKLKDAELRAKRAEKHLEIETLNCNQAIDLRHRAEKERDKALKIAKSHEVTMPEQRAQSVKTVVDWMDRQYNGHPKDSLKNLKADLVKAYGDARVQLVLTVKAQGGWTKVFKDKWNSNPIRLTFDGPPPRIADEIFTFFNDLDHGFAVTSHHQHSYGKKVWVDDDSPINLTITTKIEQATEPTPLPTTHEVEVAVVRTEVIEVEKLVPVFESPTAESTPALPMAHEELVSLIDAVLETRETERRGVPVTPTKARELDEDAEALARRIEAQRRAQGVR